MHEHKPIADFFNPDALYLDKAHHYAVAAADAAGVQRCPEWWAIDGDDSNHICGLKAGHKARRHVCLCCKATS